MQVLVHGHRLQVTPSISIASYRAKDSGRNATHIFRNSMREAASERLPLEDDLRLAPARGEFESAPPAPSGRLRW